MKVLDEITKSQILFEYCKQAALQLRYKKISPTGISTECVFCGAKKMKGTVFFANTGRLCYICWRASCPCHTAIHASKWLKEVNPALYGAYMDDISKRNNATDDEIQKMQEKFVEQFKKQQAIQQKEIEQKKLLDNMATKYFKHIEDGSALSKVAIDYCQKRMIPEEVWKKFFICHEGKYHDRLVIPFYNKDGKVTYFQARTLINVEPKYMNRIAETQLYNKDFIDKTKPVFVLEGPIDSLFLENAVATCGAGSSSKLDADIAKFENVFYIMDNDEAGNKKAGALVRQHKNVFMWNKFLNDYGINRKEVKDVNDVIVKLKKTDKFTYNDLRNYFTNITDEFMCYL